MSWMDKLKSPDVHDRSIEEVVGLLASLVGSMSFHEHALKDLGDGVIDLTADPEAPMNLGAYQDLGPEHKQVEFGFKDGNFRCVLDLDFLSGEVANARLQVFYSEPSNSDFVKKRMKGIEQALDKKFGERRKRFALFQNPKWYSSDGAVVAQVNFVPHTIAPSFSVHITQKRYE